jgi:hypothetical protein
MPGISAVSMSVGCHGMREASPAPESSKKTIDDDNSERHLTEGQDLYLQITDLACTGRLNSPLL